MIAAKREQALKRKRESESKQFAESPTKRSNAAGGWGAPNSTHFGLSELGATWESALSPKAVTFAPIWRSLSAFFEEELSKYDF